MYINRRKTIATIAAAVLVFLLGYFHEKVDAMFINERTLIGLLFIVILALAMFVFYLKYEILRIKLDRQRDYNERDDLRHQIWKLEEDLNKANKKK